MPKQLPDGLTAIDDSLPQGLTPTEESLPTGLKELPAGHIDSLPQGLSPLLIERDSKDTVTHPLQSVKEFLFTPISKQFTGQSLSERADLLNKTAQSLVNEADQSDIIRQAEAAKKGLPAIPQAPSTLSFFIKQLPSATGQALIQAADLSPFDIALMAGTAGAGKIPIGATTTGRIATQAAVGPNFIKDVQELSRLDSALKVMTPLSSRGITSSLELYGKQTPIAVKEIGSLANAPDLPTGPIKAPIEPSTSSSLPRINLDTHTAIANRALEIAVSNPESKLVQDQSQKIFRRIGDALGSGEIDVANLPDILKKYNMQPAEFAQMYVDNISRAGKELNILSQYARKIKQTLPTEAQGILKDLGNEPPTLWENISDGFKKIENVRRAMLVSQIATASRNLISQGTRYGLQIFDDVLAGAGEALTGKKTLAQSLSPLKQDLFAIGRKLNKTDRNNLNDLLDKFPVEQARLLSAPVQDVTLASKAARALNYLNTSQEYFFRKLAFDAKATSIAERNGLGMSQLTGDHINEAVQHALNLTFASAPKKGTAGSAVLGVYSKFPFLTALGNTFPRFWLNSTKFLWDFSPGGYAKLLDPAFRKTLASSEPREAIQALSKATLGTMMWSGAVALRHSKYAGDKWYEVRPDPDKNPNKVVDIRAYAPFSTYAFLADAVFKPEGLTGMDWIQNSIGINRIAGSGLIIVDMVRSGTPEKFQEKVKQFAGQYLGGFTTPFRTIKDVVANWDKEESYYRETKLNPLAGPAIANIPYVDRMLPRAVSPTTAGPTRNKNPLFRQLTGITINDKSNIQSEVDRLGLDALRPKTGSAKLDYEITNRMGYAGEVMGNALIQNPGYQGLDDDTRKEMLTGLFSQIRSGAKSMVMPAFVYSELQRITDPDQKRQFLKKFLNIQIPKASKLPPGLKEID